VTADRGARTALPWRAVLLLAALAGLFVTGLGLLDADNAVPIGALVSGTTAVAGGLVVVLRSMPVRRSELFRLLIGSSAVVWGTGQVLVGALVSVGATYPTAGDELAAFAAPLAIAGLVVAPRRASEALAGLRLLCDTLVIGGIAAAAVWRIGFVGRVDTHTPGALVGATIILLELSVAALLFVCALRELDPGMTLTAVGVALVAGSDIWTQYDVLAPGGRWPWPPMAVTCVAWPLVCAGLLHISAHPPDLADRDRPASEHRRSVVLTGTLMVLLAVLFVGLARDGHIDVVTILLSAVCVAGVSGRDLVVARQARALLDRVSVLAYVDPLTGAANRRALLEALGEAGDSSWLLTVDLDNFRSVNQLLGHAGGDALLVRAAEELAAVTPEGVVHRLGGDEFAVLADGDAEIIDRLAERLLIAVRLATLSVPGVGRVALSASVGVADVQDPRDPLEALSQSGIAMQAAKAAGRNGVARYAGVVAERSQRRRLVEVRLREAVRGGALTVNAQPIVALATGRISGLEMLARWTDPEIGRVGPDEFIAIAEASSLIVPLGQQVLETSVLAALDHELDARDLTMGINVSPVQLRVPGFADSVLSLLARYAVPPGRIVLEVTEQVFVSEDDAAEDELVRLVAGGVHIAVDDFGAGSASLGYLRRIPARILKLDRALVASVLTDPRSAAIVTSMARLGAETGLDVVAEGIEDEEIATFCRDVGIPFGQGWLFARDVPLDRLDEAVAALGGAPRTAPGQAGVTV
jgi:diguanylate cyclase (GGDEF)-like protein